MWATYENLTELTADTTFILTKNNEGPGPCRRPGPANLPSVENDSVYGLGENSFRIDKFSATEIVDGVVENFGG